MNSRPQPRNDLAPKVDKKIENHHGLEKNCYIREKYPGRRWMDAPARSYGNNEKQDSLVLHFVRM